MNRNVEIKACIANVEPLLASAAAIATEGPHEIEQDDTFFRCETGRLKLRDFLDGSGELIFYRRANLAGPKESFFIRSSTSTPGALREALSLAYGQAGRVIKHRTLFLVGRTRIHLDRVEGLGNFLELEVVLAENEPAEVGAAEAHDLLRRLGISAFDLVEGAYVDLLAARS